MDLAACGYALLTAAQMLAFGAALLQAAGIENPRREARLLLAHAAGVDQAALLSDAPLSAPHYMALVKRRAVHEPMALITGRQGFWTLDLEVSADTLIPRADSEAVVEAACAIPDVRRVLDLGTGTGCLLLAVLSEKPDATGIGVDRSEGAARLARRNAKTAGLAERAAFFCGDWATALQVRFDLVLSNPPYIETADIAGLMPEVAEFEPHAALDGGVDGLDAYRSILAALPRLLEPGGAAVLELGQWQAEAVGAIAVGQGLVVDGVRDDLSGVARAMTLRLAAE